MQILRIYESPEFLTVHAHQIFFGLIFVFFTRIHKVQFLDKYQLSCADSLQLC